MDKELVRFLNGETNYYSGTFSIGREPANGTSYYELKADDTVVKSFWGNLGAATKEKRSMGGKKPYVMLMLEKLTWLIHEGKISADCVGYLVMLTPYIEWGTGKIVKRKKPLKSEDVEKILNISGSTWDRKVKELKENGLLTVTKDGYFISTDLFKKGGAKK